MLKAIEIYNNCIKKSYLKLQLAYWVEILRMAQDTGVQSEVESYHILKN